MPNIEHECHFIIYEPIPFISTYFARISGERFLAFNAIKHDLRGDEPGISNNKTILNNLENLRALRFNKTASDHF